MMKPLTLSEIKARLAIRARELGAVAFGIARPQADPTTLARLRDAVARGDVATWNYDDQWALTAASPELHVPGAAAVICVALAYGHPAPRAAAGFGKVAAYAWAPVDYHLVMADLLRALADELRTLAGEHSAQVICDTRPLAERAVAVAAGLGWVGKHTNVIVPGVGSYVFLGEIITSVPLPPDAARRTHCGSCKRCISVCPTGALRGDYTMDATRCISDLTQVRGAIPRELRPFMGTWVWGCDLCQAACPPTQLAGWQGQVQFAPTTDAHPDLLSLLRLDTADFRRRYAHSAMGWRGAALLRRNAAVALGNTLDRATVPGLLDAFSTEGSANVRAHIAWALGRIGSPPAERALMTLLEHEPHAAVRGELRQAVQDRQPAGGKR